MNSSASDWERENTFRAGILLLDGLTGTGKTMVMRILDTFPNLSAPKFNYQFEHLCIALGDLKIDNLAGTQILQLLVDQNLYDQKIGREVNLRPRDLSSIFKSKKKFTYLSRLLASDGIQGSDRVELETETLFLVVHQLLDRTKIADNLSKKTVNRIVCFRHPYYLMDHWASYIDMHGNSPRDFTVMKGKVPWFIEEQEDYLIGTTFERAACAISTLNNRALFHINDPSVKTLAVNFEEFVLSPNKFLEEFSILLGEDIPRSMDRVLRKEHLPRIHINDTKRRVIYQRYGSDLLDDKKSHLQDYLALESRIRAQLGAKYYSLLKEAASRYEAHFGIWF
jgi:hypothetical protein